MQVIEGNSLDVLPTLAEASVDSIVTDPPYGLSFMGKEWDHAIPGVPFWEASWRVLKPGGYMLTMGGTRTYHRLACAVEDAGFEIRDCLMWIYGSGFPKGKGCLKPAWEPILLARKPGKRVLPLAVDECRVPVEDASYAKNCSGDRGHSDNRTRESEFAMGCGKANETGRWPANVLHDGSDEVMEMFGAFGDKGGGGQPTRRRADGERNSYGDFSGGEAVQGVGPSMGNAARFFYCAKASRKEREAGLEGLPKRPAGMMQDDAYQWPGTPKHSPHKTPPARNHHPTVKPLALMRWMVRLVTPQGGKVLDPFLGSGSTLVAARDWCHGIGIEKNAEYAAIARRRIAEAMGMGRGSLLAATGTGGLFG